MKKIESIKLYNAKEECLKLQKNKDRIILPGKSPILLTTKLFKNEYNAKNAFLMPSLVLDNNINNSYLDALILYLNNEYGVNGIIDYIISTDYLPDDSRNFSVDKYYSDEEVRNIILNRNIQAFFSFKVGNTIANEALEINEKMSSYSYMGLTGISEELSNLLNKYNYANHKGFGGQFNDNEFYKLGYEFTDDTISYNDMLFIGKVKNKELSKDKIWPRTVELTFKSEDDYYNLERIGAILIKYFSWVEQELKEKGSKDAMSPMKPKVYLKNI